MKTNRFPTTLAVSLVAVLAAWITFPSNVSASHTWGNFHWARTANPFTVKLIRNLTTTWRPYLDLASAAWTTPTKLNTTIVAGLSDAITRQTCPAVSGRVAVCNFTYGLTGWRGLATIWFDGNNHITQGTAKMNDSYSWTPGSRQLVMCQEVGHTFGLGHQDENFANANLGSCMDYTSLPFGPPNNLALNQHDHDQLNTIYAHLDNYATLTLAPAAAMSLEVDSSLFNERNQWGRRIASLNGGRTEIYERDLGGGAGVRTYVVWAEEEIAKRRR
jgi:hypothetical protein